MKGRIIIILTVAILLAASLAVAGPQGRAPASQDCCQGGGSGIEARLDGLVQKLQLTDEQKSAVEKIIEEAKAGRTENRKIIMRLRNRIQGEMLEDDPDVTVLEKLMREIGDLRTEQKISGMKTRLAIREQLTEEQRDRMMFMGQRKGRPPGSAWT